MELNGTYTIWNSYGGTKLVIDDNTYTLDDYIHLEHSRASGVLKIEDDTVIIGPNEIYKTEVRYKPVIVGKHQYLLHSSRYEDFLINGLGKDVDVLRKNH